MIISFLKGLLKNLWWTSGLDTIAATIGEEAHTIEDVYEPYLLQIGFLQRTPRGRMVTHLVYEHFQMEVPTD